jgi:predicted transposase YbfD/YdcC
LSKKTLELCKSIKLKPIFQVKRNQKTLLQNFKDQIKFTTPVIVITNQDNPDKGHGRIEVREIRTYKPNNTKPGRLGFITDPYWRKNIKVIIEVTRITKTKDTKKSSKTCLTKIFKTTKEKSYHFTTTATLTAKDLQKHIRGHWGIENSNHYVRDVTLKEDNSRIRKNPMVMAIIRSTALNTIRHKQSIHNNKTYQNIQQQININKWSSGFLEDYSWLWRSG